MILEPAHWPLFWPIQREAYALGRRIWNEHARAANPDMRLTPLPLRRSRTRRPAPGVLDLAIWDEG